MSGADDSFELPIDLDQVDHTVLHPITGAPTVARITLAGPTHPLRKAAMFSRMRALMADGSATNTDVESVDEEDTAFLATCTLGWAGLAQGGAPLPFAVGAALVLYTDPKFRWLRDQVRDAIRNREAFISAAATT